MMNRKELYTVRMVRTPNFGISEEGMIAYYLGIEEESNPHPPQSENYINWKSGWNYAFRKTEIIYGDHGDY